MQLRLFPWLLAGVLVSSGLAAQTDYPLGPDSERHTGTPSGTVDHHTWKSRIFPGTERDYWVYVPAQYEAGRPAAVMVFQDGAAYVKEDGRWRVPVVFDNLIARGEMPVTIGIFIEPGVLPSPSEGQQGRYNRSFEYDGLGDRYSRFLLEEILPEVGRTHTLTADPNLRGIGGSSSGGICAFTVAWHRPDAFRRVLSFIGSFVNLRGGQIYSSLIRKTEPKPIRIFLQDGSHDLNLYAGDWWIANQDLAGALRYAGYDATFVTGDQGHNGIHGSSILPDALRWLWREWRQPIEASSGAPGAERHFVTEILEPGKGWERVFEGEGLAAGPAVDREGDVYFGEVGADTIRRIDHATGRVAVFRKDSRGSGGLAFAPDGHLIASQVGRRRLVVLGSAGSEEVLALDVEPSDLEVGARGDVWFTEPRHGRVWHSDGDGKARVVHDGIASPGGLALSPDQSFLAVADRRSRWVWSFQVTEDGSLRHGEPFYRLETFDDPPSPSPGGMTVDTEGYLYIATSLGLQVCDPPGRVTAIVESPESLVPSSVIFGGPELDTLYVTAGNKVFRRRVRRHGVFPWRPVTPPKPRL
jgi:sugar lactone lactonase YvrE/enterochelin esterase-like enzyme